MKEISIATVFGEEIEKIWRGQVSPEAVFQLRLMGEQLMDMEKAIKTQQTMIEKLMKFAVLEGNALRQLQQLQADFNRQFGEKIITEDVEKEQ